MDVVQASWTDWPKAMGEGYIQPAHIMIRAQAQTKETKANVTVDFYRPGQSFSLAGRPTNWRQVSWLGSIRTCHGWNFSSFISAVLSVVGNVLSTTRRMWWLRELKKTYESVAIITFFTSYEQSYVITFFASHERTYVFRVMGMKSTILPLSKTDI